MTHYPGIGVLIVTTVDSGQTAETAACLYLEAQGFTVHERNYRQRYCEVDIIAFKDGHAFFVEVKYRSTYRYGTGFEYITAKKLNHMIRGAETWVAKNHWDGPYRLAAISVSGHNYEVTDFIDSLL